MIQDVPVDYLNFEIQFIIFFWIACTAMKPCHNDCHELTMRNAYWIDTMKNGMCLPMDDILGHMNVSNKYI